MKQALSSLVLAVLVSGQIHADEWLLPKPKTYLSDDGRYRVVVTPRQLEGQLEYFRDKVHGVDRAGSPAGVPVSGPMATLYTKGRLRYKKIGAFNLVNDVAPVSALVSNSGVYFVTFDNWHNVGFDENVVVIYRANGRVIRSFRLDELMTPGDIEVLPHTVSSVYWGGGHYLEETTRQLVLLVAGNSDTYLGPRRQPFSLHIDLETGRLHEPLRDRLPQLKVMSRVADVDATSSGAGGTTKTTCVGESVREFNDATDAEVSPALFYQMALERDLPDYPPIAWSARIEGVVVAELLVSSDGNVRCARTTGSPLLIDSAHAAALRWKFRPLQSDAPAAARRGRIVFDFKKCEPAEERP